MRKLLALSAWTIGFVAANQVALIVIRNLAEPGLQRGDRLLHGVHVLRAPPRPAGGVDLDHVPARDVARGRPQGPAVVHRADLARRAYDRAAHAAGGFRDLRAATSDRRRAARIRNFDAVDAANTADALAGFSLGLVGFSVYMFVLRGFYAHQDTRTPFVVNVGENALNIVLAFVLVDRYGVLGLGLAFAIAYLVSALWVLRILSLQGARVLAAPDRVQLVRMLLAAVLMAEAVWLVTRDVGGRLRLAGDRPADRRRRRSVSVVYGVRAAGGAGTRTRLAPQAPTGRRPLTIRRRTG